MSERILKNRLAIAVLGALGFSSLVPLLSSCSSAPAVSGDPAREMTLDQTTETARRSIANYGGIWPDGFTGEVKCTPTYAAGSPAAPGSESSAHALSARVEMSPDESDSGGDPAVYQPGDFKGGGRPGPEFRGQFRVDVRHERLDDGEYRVGIFAFQEKSSPDGQVGQAGQGEYGNASVLVRPTRDDVVLQLYAADMTGLFSVTCSFGWKS